MEFKVSPVVFLDGISLAGAVASPRSPTPEGASVRLSTKSKELWLSAITNSVSISCKVEAEIIKEGECAVDCEMLLADVSSLRSEIQAHSTKANLILKAGRASRRRRLIPLDGFPKVPTVAGDTHRLDKQELLRAIKGTVFASNKDGSRPELRCVRVDNSVFMGADGQRFASYNLDVPLSISIPQGMLDVVETVLSRGDSESVDCIAGNWLSLETEVCTLKISLLALDYPAAAISVLEKYKNADPVVEMLVDRQAMLGILSSLEVYSQRGKTYGIEYATLDFTEGYPRIYTELPDVGYFEDEVPVEKVLGKVDKVLFSPDQMKEGFSAVGASSVILKIFSPLEPMLLQDPDDDKWSLIQATMGTRATVQQMEEEDDF